jgi:hypothetical protein
VNLAKDVLRKVETNLEQHKEYSENYEGAKAWIENAKQVIWDCSEASSNSSREVLQARLDQIQVSRNYADVSKFQFLFEVFFHLSSYYLFFFFKESSSTTGLNIYESTIQ